MVTKIYGKDTRLAKRFVEKTLILKVTTPVSCRRPFICVQKKAMACSTLCLPYVINIQ